MTHEWTIFQGADADALHQPVAIRSDQIAAVEIQNKSDFSSQPQTFIVIHLKTGTEIRLRSRVADAAAAFDAFVATIRPAP